MKDCIFSLSFLLMGSTNSTLCTFFIATTGIAVNALLQQVIALHLPWKYLKAFSVTYTHLGIKVGLIEALYLTNSP